MAETLKISDIAGDIEIKIKCIVLANDWWACVKHKIEEPSTVTEVIEGGWIEEVPVMAFAQCIVTEYLDVYHEMRPILQNFASTEEGYIGTVYDPNFKDHGKIVDMYRGKGNHDKKLYVRKP